MIRSALVFAATLLATGAMSLYPLISRLGNIPSALFAIPLIVILAFCMGGEDGRADRIFMSLRHEITFQGSSPVKATVQRAGSTGFLYLDDQKRPSFRKWDGVISVVRKE